MHNIKISYNPLWAKVNTQKSVYEIDTRVEPATVTLPALSSFGEILNGQIVIVDKYGNANNNNITIEVYPESGDKIDGASSIVLNKAGDSVVISPLDKENYIGVEAINEGGATPVVPPSKFQAKLYQAPSGDLPSNPFMIVNQNFNGAVPPYILRAGVGEFQIAWEQVAPIFEQALTPQGSVYPYAELLKSESYNTLDGFYRADVSIINSRVLGVKIYDSKGSLADGLMNELSIVMENFPTPK